MGWKVMPRRASADVHGSRDGLVNLVIQLDGAESASRPGNEIVAGVWGAEVVQKPTIVMRVQSMEAGSDAPIELSRQLAYVSRLEYIRLGSSVGRAAD